MKGFFMRNLNIKKETKHNVWIYLSLSVAFFLVSISFSPISFALTCKQDYLQTGTYNTLPEFTHSINTTNPEKAMRYPIKHHPYFYGSVSGGYGVWSHLLTTDGQTGTARLALGAQRYTSKSTSFGAELSIELGNRMRINTDNAISIIGIEPVFLTIRPPLSVLFTATFHPAEGSVFLFVKGGGAYLSGMLDSLTIPNKSQILPEAQFGFGVDLMNNLSLITYYQHLFGHNPVLTDFNELNGTAHLNQLPTFQAGFIGLQMAFDSL